MQELTCLVFLEPAYLDTGPNTKQYEKRMLGKKTVLLPHRTAQWKQIKSTLMYATVSSTTPPFFFLLASFFFFLFFELKQVGVGSPTVPFLLFLS